MRSLWNGSISFGLVNVPVKMFAATEDKDVRFRTLHKECNTPIQYRKFCPNCEREVANEELVKGFEYERGQFVIITEEDLQALAVSQTRAIEIEDFVNLPEIDPIYYHKTYYLAPGETGQKAYWLLRRAMEQTNKIAIARIVLRDKQRLAAVRVLPDCLSLSMMFYPDEIRATSELRPDQPVQLHEKELLMATQLIDSLTQPFDASKYKDDYREELLQLVEARVAGAAVAIPDAPRQNKVVDLMEALKASLEMVEKNREEKQARPTGND
ncbi:MAG: Ku protein [Bacillota bacterium]